MTSLTLDRHKGHNFTYDVVQAGFNYRIDEIHSALGRVQLEKLPDNNARRLKAAARLRQALDGAEIAGIPFAKSESRGNGHIFPILLNPETDRLEFMKSMREKGIQTSVHYRPAHTFSHYRETMESPGLSLTEEIGRREVTLPIYPGLSEEQIDYIARAVRGFFA